MSLQDNQGPYTWRDTWGSAEELAHHIALMADDAARRGRYDDANSLGDAAACIRELEEDIEALKGDE